MRPLKLEHESIRRTAGASQPDLQVFREPGGDDFTNRRQGPLAKHAATNERDPDYAVTVVGLLLYLVVVAGVLVLLDIE